MAQFMSGDAISEVWSNTGTILSQNSWVTFKGQFTSADVRNVRRNGGFINIDGTMDNTADTFTFTADTGSFYLARRGRIVGGTLAMTGPTARLDFHDVNQGGTLDGVTINGDIALGGFRADLGFGSSGGVTGQVRVVNGLTLNGTVTFSSPGAAENVMFFEGAQTVSGGVFQKLSDPLFGPSMGSLKAIHGGPVTLDASVTIRAGDGPESIVLVGHFINYATITVDRDSAVGIGSFGSAPGQEFTNRGSIHANPGSHLAFRTRAINESTIFADQARVFLGGQGWRNAGVIEASNSQLEFGFGGAVAQNRLQTADLGTVRNPGGTMMLGNDTVLDNTGSTLVIDSALTGTWKISSKSMIEGGTVQIVPGSRMIVGGGGVAGEGTLKDLTVQGDFEFGVYGMNLVGDLTFQGAVKALAGSSSRLTFGETRFSSQPLVIHAGTFDFGGRFSKTIEGFATTSGDITFGPAVVIRGRNVQATFVRPLLNQGQIIADLVPLFPGDTGDNMITFTSAPITNEGLLEARGGGRLTISDLVTNRGTIAARAGSIVSIGGDLPQEAGATVTVDIAGPASSQFGQMTVVGAATLAGTLNIQLSSGYQPAVGDTFPILTYASHTGTFANINGLNLPNNRSFNVVYGTTGLTLTVVQNLQAAGAPPAGGLPESARLTPEQTRAILDAATQTWAAAGLDEAHLDRLRGVELRVADLGGYQLGQFDGRVITLDDDAAGYGWFVDPTPQTDEEFSVSSVDGVFAASATARLWDGSICSPCCCTNWDTSPAWTISTRRASPTDS